MRICGVLWMPPPCSSHRPPSPKPPENPLLWAFLFFGGEVIPTDRTREAPHLQEENKKGKAPARTRGPQRKRQHRLISCATVFPAPWRSRQKSLHEHPALLRPGSLRCPDFLNRLHAFPKLRRGSESPVHGSTRCEICFAAPFCSAVDGRGQG